MTTPIIITAQGGSVSVTPITGGTWPATFDPPDHPNATIPVPCVKPGVGMFLYLPDVEGGTYWLCVGETVIIQRTEGIAGGWNFWDRVDSFTTQQEGRWLSSGSPLYLSSDMTSGGFAIPSPLPDYGDEECWWWDHSAFSWARRQDLMQWAYYRNSLVTFSPCEESVWDWQTMYANWSEKMAGKPAFEEWYHHRCYWIEIEEWQPQMSFMLPTYAGGLALLSGLLGGGGGGFGGAVFMPFVLAALQAASSASAAAAGRVLKASDQEDMLDFL